MDDVTDGGTDAVTEGAARGVAGGGTGAVADGGTGEAGRGREEISTDPGRLDLPRIHHWLSTDAYWALGRPLEKVGTSVRNSLNFGAYAPDGEQIGYARVVTDHATFAWLCDVYVTRHARGQGVGTRLVTAARNHLTPLGLRRILLATHDAHEVYAKLGFTALGRPGDWMALEVQ
jgi:GNAT superfamily N-acetyltransferase